MKFLNRFRFNIWHGFLFMALLLLAQCARAAFPSCYGGGISMSVTDNGNGNATFRMSTGAIAARQYMAVYTPSGLVLRSSNGAMVQCVLPGGSSSCSVNYQTNVAVNTTIMAALSLRPNSDYMVATSKCSGQQNFNITPVPPATGCNVSSPTSLTVQWGNVSASSINSRSAPVKVAAININCGRSPFPIYTTLTNSSGVNDAINGVMKTSSGRIGISAKWNDNGSAIPIGTRQSWPSQGGQRDFSIRYALTPLAEVGQESTGAFSTINTLSIEYR
ncbi:Uncharacterised protein [Serratia quinivorans]|nr:Uncharacterised protein [Serratia quinivorans]